MGDEGIGKGGGEESGYAGFSMLEWVSANQGNGFISILNMVSLMGTKIFYFYHST